MIASGLVALGILGLLAVLILRRPRKRSTKGALMERLPDNSPQTINLVGKIGARHRAK
jgi:hypothetical protein